MESLRNLFEHLLRKYALPPIPVFPARLPGWGHRPKGCGPRCQPCQGLDLFLTNPQQQAADFSHLKTGARDHVTRRLPSDLFKCVLDVRRNGTFLVHKRSQDGEFREAFSEYEAMVRAVQDSTKDFRGEHFRKILGEELYSELVLLEGPRGSRCSCHLCKTATGVKREAEEELVPPPRPGVRQWAA